MEHSKALLPATIAMILKSQRPDESSDWVFDGQPYAKVQIVAQLISVVESETKIIYTFDDGTGRITGHHWLSDNEKVEAYWRDLVVNTYIRVIASVGIFHDKKYLQLDHICHCEDPHETYFHLGEVMTSNLMLHRGPPPKNQDAESARGSDLTVSTEDQTVAAFAHLKDLPALQRSIVMLLIEKQGGMDQPGVNVVDIVTNIDASDAVEIDNALQALMDFGYIYEGDDGSTFRAIL